MLKTSFGRTLLAAAAVLLLLAATLLGLRLIQNGQDGALFTRVHARTLAEGECAPAAEAIPLVRALWDRERYYLDTAREWRDRDAAPIAAGGFSARDTLNALVAAGVVPSNTPWDIDVVYPAGLWPAGPGFTSCHGMLLYDGGTVVRLSTLLPKGMAGGLDLAAACANYLAYLGLDGLDDWEEASLAHPEAQWVAEYYSPGAQLLVQLTLDTRTVEGDLLLCGVYPLSREAYALQAGA